MGSQKARGRTVNIQRIDAPRESVYRAFVEPEQLVQWLAPEGMTGQIHHFDARVGGRYEMSLFYAPTADDVQGKTSEREDRFTARFLELDRPRRVVQGVLFTSSNPAFHGEMKMVVTLTEDGGGTKVKMVFEDIPWGIRPEDNEAGSAASLRKLARLLES